MLKVTFLEIQLVLSEPIRSLEKEVWKSLGITESNSKLTICYIIYNYKKITQNYKRIIKNLVICHFISVISKKNTKVVCVCVCFLYVCVMWGFPAGSDSKESACNECRRSGFNSWFGKISWRREWLPIQVFLPGEFCGERSMADYSPRGRKESDTAERPTLGASQAALVVKNLPANAGDLKTQVQSLGWEDPLEAQSYLALRDPVDCSPPGFSVHGIFQTRILEWVAIFFCRGSSWPRDQTHISYVSCIGRRFFFYHWATWEAHFLYTYGISTNVCIHIKSHISICICIYIPVYLNICICNIYAHITYNIYTWP